MSTTYGRSTGGYIWALLDPIGGIAILSFVFTLFLKAPPLGFNFPLFYATGYLPFMIYTAISSKMAVAIRFSKPLLAYPSVTFIDALLARFTLTFLTQTMATYLVILGTLAIYDTNATLDFPALLLALAMTAALGAGIGTLNCYIMTAFPIWERIWQIVTRPLFIISGVFFLYDNLPMAAQNVLWYNPLVHVVSEMRVGIYQTYKAPFVSEIYVFLISGLSFAMGLLLLRRHYRDLANEG